MPGIEMMTTWAACRASPAVGAGPAASRHDRSAVGAGLASSSRTHPVVCRYGLPAPSSRRVDVWRSRTALCAEGERAAGVATAESTGSVDRVLDLELDTRQARKTVKLTVLPELANAIVVGAVAERCEAYEAGLRPGMRLLKISDPARQGEVWDIVEGSSFKFVCDAIRYRNFDTISMSFGAPPPGLMEALAEGDASRVQRSSTPAQRRKKAREDYMDQVGQRDDRAFFAAAALCFIVPALVMLAWAASAGYLTPNTSLYSSY